MRYTRYEPRATRAGLTLVELLVALVVTSIVLTAVATLAFAMRTATDVTDDTSSKQAQVRFATLRISELIRHCKLICDKSDSRIIVWRADGELNDQNVGQININELVYVQKEEVPASDYLRLRLYQFPSSYMDQKSLAEVATISPSDYGIEPVTLISECIEVNFECYDSNLVPIISPPPPWTKTKFVNIELKILENGIEHRYQINNTLACWAGNLLNEDGTEVVSDDD